MLRQKVSVSSRQALSIDDIDPNGTPSLVGFWKCHDVDLSTNTMPDHSMYGHDLAVSIGRDHAAGFRSETVAQMLTTRPGWFTVKADDHAIIDVAGTPLDSLDKVILVACEMIYEAGNVFGQHGPDIDVGTSHDIGETDTGEYTGWMVGGAFEDNYFRVTHRDGVNYNQFSAPNVTDPIATGKHVDAETEFVIAGAFVPGTAVYASVDRTAVETVTTALSSGNAITSATSLTAQNGQFAIRGVNPYELTSVRNLQVWSWAAASAPSATVLKDTVEWMTYNPGKIPAWLVGR